MQRHFHVLLGSVWRGGVGVGPMCRALHDVSQVFGRVFIFVLVIHVVIRFCFRPLNC